MNVIRISAYSPFGAVNFNSKYAVLEAKCVMVLYMVATVVSIYILCPIMYISSSDASSVYTPPGAPVELLYEMVLSAEHTFVSDDSNLALLTVLPSKKLSGSSIVISVLEGEVVIVVDEMKVAVPSPVRVVKDRLMSP